MNQDWIEIADALRHEVADYGGLLHLFEQQQRSLFARDADGVLRLSAEIEQQVVALNARRRHREDRVAGFAVSRGADRAGTLRSLLPHFSDDVRPLIEALMNEVNVLIHRVRRVSRHNHTLLARAVETHQQTLRTLRPDAFTQTYSPSGRAALSAARPTPALRAAG